MNTTKELIEALTKGEMVILLDDEDRENEGDLVLVAEKCTPEKINFMITHARGLVCLALEEDICKKLELPLMVSSNSSAHHTNFTISIEASEGVSTGISAFDRSHTIRTAIAKDAKATDLVSPGHIFPLMAKKGGVRERKGHTEAGVELAKLAGFRGGAVIVEVINADGTMARKNDLLIFAKLYQLKIGTIKDLLEYLG